MVIIAGIHRSAVYWQRQGGRTCLAVPVDCQRRQMRIGGECDARASVVVQNQITAAVRIDTAHIGAAGRIRSALQYALLSAVSRDDRIKECERRRRRNTRAQWVCHDHDTTAGTSSKVVADGRVLNRKRAVQRENCGSGIAAVTRSVRAILGDSTLSPVHIVTGEGAVADDYRTALIEDGASESSASTATATAVTASSETASVPGFAVRINVGADAEARAATKTTISSMKSET